MPVAPLIVLFAGVAVAVLNPLGAAGDAWIGAGGGDLVNGAVGLGLILAGGLWAVIAARKAKGTK
jgi:hypothetical protein